MEERNSRRRAKRVKGRCKECAHSIFDEVWGEYKCRARMIRIYNIDNYANCKDFKKKESQ